MKMLFILILKRILMRKLFRLMSAFAKSKSICDATEESVAYYNNAVSQLKREGLFYSSFIKEYTKLSEKISNLNQTLSFNQSQQKIIALKISDLVTDLQNLNLINSEELEKLQLTKMIEDLK